MNEAGNARVHLLSMNSVPKMKNPGWLDPFIYLGPIWRCWGWRKSKRWDWWVQGGTRKIKTGTEAGTTPEEIPDSADFQSVSHPFPSWCGLLDVVNPKINHPQDHHFYGWDARHLTGRLMAGSQGCPRLCSFWRSWSTTAKTGRRKPWRRHILDVCLYLPPKGVPNGSSMATTLVFFWFRGLCNILLCFLWMRKDLWTFF